MNTPFHIYARSFGIYLLLTLPALAIPPIYLVSAGFAFFYGFVAMAVFSGVFFLLHLVKPKAYLAITILVITVAIAVGTAYKILLVTAMQEINFWEMDISAVFPIIATISGWISIGVSHKEIIRHFTITLPDELEAMEGYETIFTYDKTLTK